MADSIFAAEAPAASFNDGTTYELGLAFRADVDGTVSGVPVYGPSTPPTSITVSLYAIDSSVAGTLLASKLAAAPLTPNTWNLILFDAPVAVTAGAIYRVQHRTPDWYTHTSARFSTAAVTVGHLTAIQDAVEPPADPYRNGSLLVGTGYASASASAAWFGNDVLFDVAGGPITVALGQATETDTAAAFGRSKLRSIGQAAELDSATTFGRRKVLTFGQAAEVDTAALVAPAHAVRLGQATELDTAAAFGRTKRRTLGRAVETDTARRITTGGGVPAATDLRHISGPQRARHLAGPQRATHYGP